MTPPNDTAEAWFEQGQWLHQQQRWNEAAEAFRQAVARDPTKSLAWSLLGRAEQNLGNYARSEEAFQRSLAIAPGNIETQICYAFLLNQDSRPSQAVELLQNVVAQVPQLSIAWLVLGHAYDLLGNPEGAEMASRRAVECAPGDGAARFQLANTLFFRWQLSESLFHIRQLLAMQHNHADALALMGLILRAFFRHEESLDALRRSLTLAPNPLTGSKLLAGLQYAEGSTAETLLKAHREWDAMYGAPAEHSASPPVKTRHGGPLRLGFLSADFGQHPTSFLILPGLERIDKQRYSITCYCDRVAEDPYTARFRAIADQWRSTLGTPAPQLAEQIRRDEIDILFDMSGHFGERMPLLVLRPAPTQITWFGYVGTTGLRTMDYLLADAHHVRPDEDRWYSEKVLRMPAGYGCYQPPTDAPDVTPLPAVKNGYVTFGCFNNPAKFSPAMFDAWAEILHRVPTARLLLKFGWLGDPELQQDIRRELSQRGVAMDRLLIETHAPQRELMATYGRIDLALDTQPYSGGLTTCESLWMGVPAITFPGKTFAGRHSTSHLSNAGYSQFVAADRSSYVDLAVDWAGRIQELAAIRAEMRNQVRQSPLCDSLRFATDLMNLLESIARPF